MDWTDLPRIRAGMYLEQFSLRVRVVIDHSLRSRRHLLSGHLAIFVNLESPLVS